MVVAVICVAVSVLIIISGLGNAWQYFSVLYNIIEVIIFVMIVWQAWNWPVAETEGWVATPVEEMLAHS